MRNGISFPACPNAVRMANSIPPQHGTSMRVSVTERMSFRAKISVSFSAYYTASSFGQPMSVTLPRMNSLWKLP